MSRSDHGDIPLPGGWDVGCDFDGKVYFIDHHNRKTTWIDPRDSYTKAQTFADCVGHELPYGWEECYDPQIGIYYINHVNQENQIEDPRLKWRNVQEQMLSEYLHSAQADLTAKQDILNVKTERLALAKDHYHQLNRTFSNVYSSKSSVSSTGSGEAKLNPEVLKVDLAVAKSRVGKLKRELQNMKHEVANTQMGMETLIQVKEKFSNITAGYTLEEARAIMCELKSVEESLRLGQKEKADLIHSLTVLGEDLTCIDFDNPDDPPRDAVSEGLLQKNNMASQTEFCGEGLPLGGAQLAELTRLKLEYDATKAQIKNLQHDLASLDERLSPVEVESDRDRLLLIQEKEQLLREVRVMCERSSQPSQICELKAKRKQLEIDLAQVLMMNNKAVEDRLKLQERRRDLLDRLRDTLRRMVVLEKQLKSISASTLSVSSSSSSLGSLSNSSKGSLSSLSFTDIYGNDFYAGFPVDPNAGTVSSAEQVVSSVSTLQKRVERLLRSNSESDRKYAEKLRSLEEKGVADGSETDPRSRIHSQSMLSLSPRSSLSSLSPPGDSIQLDEVVELATVHERLAGLALIPEVRDRVVPFETVHEDVQGDGTTYVTVQEGVQGVEEEEEGLLMPSMSAAVSDESVAGDSGVYEACTKGSNSPDCLETPQVQLKLRYKKEENLLFIVIERARNLSSLFFGEANKVCIKVQLFPSGASPFTCCTHLDNNLIKPTFGESFSFIVSPRKLSTKTIQVNVWAVHDDPDTIEIPEEECVGYVQISLADFALESAQTRWYNILNYSHIRPDSVARETRDDVSSKSSTLRSSNLNFGLKEESSDESTIISSQTSTLTRNMGPDALRHNLSLQAEEQDYEVDSEDDDDYFRASAIGDSVVEETEKGFTSRPITDPILENVVFDTTIENDPNNSLVETADKETNTECMFSPPPASSLIIGARSCGSQKAGLSAIKRSQTFTPSAVRSKNSYRCRLNRSDSDSCVPLTRKVPFERGAVERKSLRWKERHGTSLRLSSKQSGPASAMKSGRTSMDLDLDLAAQQLRLQQLKKEIEGLKNLKVQLQNAKASPEAQQPWASSDLPKAINNLASQNSPVKTPEDRRVQRMLRRNSREIHKLRHSNSPRGQPDVVSFKEKIAFFFKARNTIPSLDLDRDLELEITEEPLDDSEPNASAAPSGDPPAYSQRQGGQLSTAKPQAGESASQISRAPALPNVLISHTQGAGSHQIRVLTNTGSISPHKPSVDFKNNENVKHTLSIFVPSTEQSDNTDKLTGTNTKNNSDTSKPVPLIASGKRPDPSGATPKVFHPDVLLDDDDNEVHV